MKYFALIKILPLSVVLIATVIAGGEKKINYTEFT